MAWEEDEQAVLNERYELRWQIWHVRPACGRITWHARPYGAEMAGVHADSPEELAEILTKLEFGE